MTPETYRHYKETFLSLFMYQEQKESKSSK